MEVFSVENHPHPGWLSSKPCLIHQRVPHAATNWSQGAFPGGPINWGVTVVLPFAFRLQDVHLWSNRYEAILGSMKILQITSNIDRKNNELCGSMKQNKITPPTIWMSWSPMPSATKCDAIGAKGGGLGSAWARTATSGAEGPEIHRVSCRFSLKPIRQSIDTMWGHLEKDEKDCMRIDSPTWDLGLWITWEKSPTRIISAQQEIQGKQLVRDDPQFLPVFWAGPIIFLFFWVCFCVANVFPWFWTSLRISFSRCVAPKKHPRCWLLQKAVA